MELHPRELSKLVAKVFGFVALAHAAERVGEGILLMIPVVSVGIGAGLNYAFSLKGERRANGVLAVLSGTFQNVLASTTESTGLRNYWARLWHVRCLDAEHDL